MAEPVIPGLTQNPDGTYTVGAATIPATAELTAGQTVTVNGVVYTLVKYLGGGTYGKVWSVTSGGYEYSIKIINVQEDTITATKSVIKEAQLTKKLYDKTSLHPICSNIYGIGITTGNFVIIVMDVFEITLDWYLENGGSAKPEELILKFYKMLEKVNDEGMQTSHGDVKGDNFMINSDGTLRAVDFGFGHIKEGDFEITCTSEFNSKNIGMNRDIVQFVVYLTLFYRNKVSKQLASSIAPIFLNITRDKSLGGVGLWNKTYRYLNEEPSARDINAVAKNIITLVTPHTSLAVSFTLPVAGEEEVEPPPVVTEAPLPTPATIAATIEDKLTIKSSRTPAEVMARVEEIVTEEERLERIKVGEAARLAAGKRKIEGEEASEAKRKRTTGGARKTRRHSRSRKTRKRKSKRKTRSK